MSITLLDGGMGQELLRRSGRKPTPLWSTQVLMDEPDLVRQVHDDFFAACATSTARAISASNWSLPPYFSNRSGNNA